jgi:hypothetical protein
MFVNYDQRGKKRAMETEFSGFGEVAKKIVVVKMVILKLF